MGVPLDLLPRLPDAIRKLPLSERKNLLGPAAEARDASTYSESGSPPKGQPPREVWRLMESLMNTGETPGLWTSTVPLEEVLAVIDALDSGDDVIPGSPQAVAHALLFVLYKLSSPLIPRKMHILCKTVMSRDEVYAIVERIPSVNANVSSGVVDQTTDGSGVDRGHERRASVLRGRGRRRNCPGAVASDIRRPDQLHEAVREGAVGGMSTAMPLCM